MRAPLVLFSSALVASTALACGANTSTTDFSDARQQVAALGHLTRAPDFFPAEGFPPEGEVHALFYDALPWKGRPTRVFAWIGLPGNRSGKVPGIVLVHGGGGTAFKEWVRKWNDRGFAAISIAVEGQTDRRSASEANTKSNRMAWERHAWAGPSRNEIYGDFSEPLADQWIFHAVADTILANSLLRALPEVDATKVGVMGISWGGVITSTVIGLDARFAFAIPTYGCGHLFDAPNQYGRALAQNELYRQVWDPMVWLDRAKMPLLWFSWPEDSHFPMDCLAACSQAAGGPRMVALVPGLRHGHTSAWNPPHSYAFAESIVREGKPWCWQTLARLQDGIARVEFSTTRPLDGATLISTANQGMTDARTWRESAAVLQKDGEHWIATASLPAGTTAWYINVHWGELVASSDYQSQL